MQYTVEIIRWKRESCELVIEAKNIKDAERQALSQYHNEKLEEHFNSDDTNFNANKDERIKIYNKDFILEQDKEF